jgi:multidrug transporter EmrE-like cation transporter
MYKLTFSGLLLILATVAFTVIGQLLVKKGMLNVGASPAQLVLVPRFLLRAFTNLYVIAGLVFALLAALTWTVAVSRLALNVAYPFLGLGIVLVLVCSGLFFGEAVPPNRWIGVAIVCVGLVVAARN